MKARTRGKFIAVCIALIMVLTSGNAVFAATDSPTNGGKPATVTKMMSDVNYKNKSIKITYKAKNAVKYKIAYRVKGGKWKYRTTTNKYYTLKKLAKNKKYQIKVAGINKNGKVGKYHTIAYRWMKKINYKLTSATKSKAIKVKITKVKGATKYQITYSLKANMSNSKTVTTKGLTKTIKNLKKGKVYYVRIRAISGKYKGMTIKKKIRVK